MSSDITKCMSISCQMALMCWRTQAPDNALQSYSDFSEDCQKNNFCWIYPMPINNQKVNNNI